MEIEHPYLLFLGDVHDQLAAKTAQGVVDWRPDWCAGQMRLEGCQADTGLTDMSIDEAVAVSNYYAPEHLIMQVKNARRYLDQVINAGSVFLGPFTPESVGDYCSGTNHVLPTYGYARAYSGLSLVDFQKRMSVQELTEQGVRNLQPTVSILARMEGLDAHARAVEVRVERLDEQAGKTKKAGL